MLYDYLRKASCNFDEIEKFIPKKGKILDVGSGKGIFSTFLYKKSKQREILGIDPSSEKIKWAQKESLKNSHLKFKNAYIKDVNVKFDAVVIIDVIYLLPTKEKEKMLQKAHSLLKNNGTLILVINGKEPRWIYNILELQEKFMTFIFKFTYTDFKETHFETEKETEKLLSKNRFQIKNVKKFKSTLPYPHILFSAVKK